MNHVNANSEIKISIIVLVYNHEKYLERALNSIICQQHDFPIEILIGDDCSSDRSPEIIKKFEQSNCNSNQHVRTFIRNKNFGAAFNVSHLANLSNGKYITFLEGDDYWCSDTKLIKQFEFLQSNPDYIAVTHPLRVEDLSGNFVFNTPSSYSHIFTLENFLRGKRFPLTAAMIRKNNEEIQHVSSLISKGPRNAADVTWCFYLLSKSDVYILSEPMAAYNMRVMGGESNYNSISTDLRKCEDRLLMLDINNNEYQLGGRMLYLYSQLFKRVVFSFRLSLADQLSFFRIFAKVFKGLTFSFFGWAYNFFYDGKK
ncbi:glycosyltransferase family 2 protein [Shewanella chilikensis]|uniref:glycosyltransferase family 2 protein n=1 Tax=Shewanella chilikensis TaxID=558541 RepID=UPI003003B9DE